MRVVTYTAFVGSKRRMKVLLGTPFLFLLYMTLVAQFWIWVFNEILGLCLGIVTAKATPNEIRTMNKWLVGDHPSMT